MPDVMTLENLVRELEIPLTELFDLKDSNDKAAPCSNREPERKADIPSEMPRKNDIPDSPPDLLIGGFQTYPKIKWPKLLAVLLSLILIGIVSLAVRQ